jgi:diaminohydroxyphosphoribosylaminopyrimidine deaminase/5-amino-6-(5-phosphoribosylamino)uracil reductase
MGDTRAELGLIDRPPVLTATLLGAFEAAFDAAAALQGATAPNPPVGCAILDAAGVTLAIAAHTGAGRPHAEAVAIALCRAAGVEERIHTVVVTLEPCNHTGRTPPCVEAILATPARRVVIGAADPNPHVAGGGAAALTVAGLDVAFVGDLPGGAPLAAASRRLIAPFVRRAADGRPWVTVKRAFDQGGSMIPPPGAKTFTAPASLDLAHALRRRADAILTGIGTVLADGPLFTVRRLADHSGRRRTLVVLDRHERLPPEYAPAAALRGLNVRVESDLGAALDRLAADGALEVLVEAGPRLSAAVLDAGLWDEAIDIHAGPGGADRVERRYRAGEQAWEALDVLRHR